VSAVIMNIIGVLLFLIGLSFIVSIYLLFIFSGRISEQEERISGTVEESQAGFDLFGK
jgi:hypothetical protein